MNIHALAAVLTLFDGLARASGPASPHADPVEEVRLYHEGVRLYAEGDSPAALVLFREVARREPRNRAALVAIRRLEVEAARRSATTAPAATGAGSVERFFLRTIPRWYFFERTLGDVLRDVGAQNALNAMIEQLLSERKIARAQRRPFRKERRLRELLRRAPFAAASANEV